MIAVEGFRGGNSGIIDQVEKHYEGQLKKMGRI